MSPTSPSSRRSWSSSDAWPTSRTERGTLEVKLVDLTQPWGDRMPTWPQFEAIQVTDITTHHRDGKSTVLVRTNMHTGTHIDAPIHYWPTGKHLGEIPIGDLYGTGFFFFFSCRVHP